MSLPQIHDFMANAVSLFTLIIALFALFRFLRREPLGGDFWGTVVIGEIMVVLQAIIGGIMVAQGIRPYQTIHYLYGAVALLTWPATYIFTQNQDSKRQTLTWLGVGLFMFVMLTWRARSTGAPLI